VEAEEQHEVITMRHYNIRGNEMTKGEYRVGIDFNPSGDARVNQIKRAAADLIDLIETTPTSAETGEVNRLKAMAQTHVEDAAM